MSNNFNRYVENRILVLFCLIKAAYSVTMNIFRKKNLFKSFVKVELSYVVTINLISTAENCMEKCIIL